MMSFTKAEIVSSCLSFSFFKSLIKLLNRIGSLESKSKNSLGVMRLVFKDEEEANEN